MHYLLAKTGAWGLIAGAALWASFAAAALLRRFLVGLEVDVAPAAAFFFSAAPLVAFFFCGALPPMHRILTLLQEKLAVVRSGH